MGTGSFPGVKQPGPGVDHHHHLVPRLKKEWNYTSTPRLSLRGIFYDFLPLPLTQRGTLLVAHLVEALRYKPEGRGFDSR